LIAGQERFRAITSSYYRGAHIVMIVYDVTNRTTWENVKTRWLDQVRKFASEQIILVLVGNKSGKTPYYYLILILFQMFTILISTVDMPNRAVSPEEVGVWAYENKIQCTEVSAKTGLHEGGVEKLFQWTTDGEFFPSKNHSS